MKQRTILKRRFSAFGFLILLLFCTQVMHAQKITITGIVTDDTGEPLPGVAVLVVGKNQSEIGTTFRGTTTDFDGNYTINVDNRNRNLVFTYMGYEKKVIRIGAGNVINTILKPSVSQLEEVVIVQIGYGEARKSDLTGAIEHIKAKDLERTQNMDLGDALAGKISGVQIIDEDGTPGGGFKINIRGAASITGSTEPLYVVDGFPIEVFGDSDDASEFEGGNSSNPLDFLDMSSIESIDILKDASATAIYGARGANGVVIITTKKGSIGKTKFTYSTSYSTSTTVKNRMPEAMSTSQLFDYVNKIDYYELVQTVKGETTGNRQWNEDTQVWNYIQPLENFGIERTDNDGIVTFIPRDEYHLLPSTNWQDELFGSGDIKNHSLTASGGKEGSLYSFTGSYLDQTGNAVNSGYEKFSFNGKLNTDLTDRLSALTTFSQTISKKFGAGGGGSHNSSSWGLFARAIQAKPYIPLSDDSDIDGYNLFEDSDEEALFQNPVYQAENTINIARRTNYNFGTKLKYKITDDLIASTSFAYRTDLSNTKFYNPPGFGRAGKARLIDKKQTGYVNNNTLLYKGKIKKHRYSLLVGYTQQTKRSDKLVARAEGFEANIVNGAENLDKAITTITPVTTIEEVKKIGMLSRFSYAFDNKYSLTASVRRDGDSRFNKNNRYKYFPSAGFAWTASKEDFLKDSDVIDNLKIRLTYGEGGNSGIRSASSRDSFVPMNYSFGGQLIPGEGTEVIIDPNLTWQTTKQFDAGFDLSMFNSRIRLTTDIYSRKTVDMILSRPLPIEQGYKVLLTNIGDIKNYGLEIGLNTINIEKDNFRWDTNLTLSFDRSEVLSLGGVEQQFFGNRVIGGSPNVLQVGENIGNWYGYKMDGVYNTQEELDAHISIDNEGNEIPVTKTIDGRAIELGDPKYMDLNNDGKIDHNDRTIITKTNPDFYGGLWNNFKIGDFELGLFFRFKYNFDVINGNKLKHTYNVRFGNNNQLASNLNAWSPDNVDSEQPRFGLDPETGITDALPLSSYHVEDGSFIRLQNINMRYNFSTETMRKIDFLNNLQVYFNLNNVFLWTKYTGTDPETSVSRGSLSSLSPNLDWGAYPKTRNFTLGIKATF